MPGEVEGVLEWRSGRGHVAATSYQIVYQSIYNGDLHIRLLHLILIANTGLPKPTNPETAGKEENANKP
jgi:hypothetical protein